MNSASKPVPAARLLCLLGLALGITGAGGLAASPASAADAFPARPIRFIVPFPPGTTTDVVARLVSIRTSDRLGQQIVVDNRAGASGTIGVGLAAVATPDGYTWVLGTTTTHALAPTFNPKLAYQPARDFAPVTLLGDAPYFLTTYPGMPLNNVRDLIAYARANPGKVHYASVGNFSLGHLSGELLKKAGGFEMVHVPYKGSTLALVDLLAGRIQLNISTIPASLPHVRAGKLRALAVTTSRRVSALPQTPTVAESGFPDYRASLWMGVFVPAGTPRTLVSRLNRDISTILGSPDLKNALQEQAFDAGALSPADFSRLVRNETARWKKVIEDAGFMR